MSSPEFDLIRQFFTEQTVQRPDVLLGIGDDAAIVSPSATESMLVSADMLLSGVHFPEDTAAHAVGHKALAVNLSDMAAMGANPAWVTLSISLPENNSEWLSGFSQGFFALAEKFGVQLIGGDTTRGPLNISVQITGFAPPGQALLRSGAQPGEGVFLTGSLGDAGLGLRLYQHPNDAARSTEGLQLIQRLQYPQPRVAAGLALRGLASSAIDVSDGLAADLQHILTASAVGAEVDITRLPLSRAYRSLCGGRPWQQAVSAGDDYELCFTAPMAQEKDVLSRLAALGCPCVRIGEVSAQAGLHWRDAAGQLQIIRARGFDHFQENIT
jgi:thiamine-monophosphate kinase